MESDLEGATSKSLVKFDEVKPICCDVMKNPSEEHLLKLWKFLKTTVPLNLSPEVSNYIIFPLVIHLKACSRLPGFKTVDTLDRSKAKEMLVKCVETVLSKSLLENHQIFWELFQNFSMLLGIKNNQPSFELNLDLSEELVMSVEMCIWFLLKELTPPRMEILYQESTISSVGHCIFMQIQVVNSDLILKIRMKALEIIERLFSATSGNPALTHRMFSFIPGVAIALRKAATSRVGRSRKTLICKSVDVLHTCVVITLEGEPEESLDKVDANLSILVQSLSDELVSHEEEELRAALSRFSMKIISSCEQKLPKCCEILWRNIHIQRWDVESESIRQSSQLFLRSTKDETSFEECLKLLKKSYSQLLSNNAEESELNLKLFASSLLKINLLFVEITLLLPPLVNLFAVAIIQNRLNVGTDRDSILFRRNSFPRICHQLCEVIKEITSPNDVVEEIVPFLSMNSAIDFSDRLENNLIGTLFFFNNLMLSYFNDTNLVDDLQSVDLPNISSLYLEILNTQVNRTVEAVPRVSSALECERVLLIEGLGTFASIDSRVVLPLVLYYLLEQAGNSSVLIANTAEQALSTICSTYSRDFSLQDLLTDNLDLIMAELSIRISSISSHPQCSNALTFLAKYFDFAQSEFVSFIEQVFSQSCDQFYSVSQEPFTRIFLAFVLSLWMRQKRSTKEVDLKNKKSLAEKILEYQRSLGIETDCETKLHDDFKIGDCEYENEIISDEKKTLGPEINLVSSICQRVLNFLPNKIDRSIQISSLDCLIYGVQLLQNEENVVLPLAHTIWQNLMPRFGDNDLNVVRKSFELLLTLCKCSGSFMKKRIVMEALPKLSSLLLVLSEESERFHHKNTLYYTHTQSYKLQATLLEGLAELCVSIELNEEELDQVVSGCLVYLKPHQHKNLMEAASKLLKVFAYSEHGSVIWMKLYTNGVQVLPTCLAPPSAAFTPFPEIQH